MSRGASGNRGLRNGGSFGGMGSPAAAAAGASRLSSIGRGSLFDEASGSGAGRSIINESLKQSRDSLERRPSAPSATYGPIPS